MQYDFIATQKACESHRKAAGEEAKDCEIGISPPF
jgi:hypothetical protein